MSRYCDSSSRVRGIFNFVYTYINKAFFYLEIFLPTPCVFVSVLSYCVHELFGFDILLDRHLKPWVLEVNISPSLHSNSQLDVNIKGRLVRDMFNIAGIRLHSRDVLNGM